MEEGENPARTTPTSNPDPGQKQGDVHRPPHMHLICNTVLYLKIREIREIRKPYLGTS